MPFRILARRLRLLLGRPAFERDVLDEMSFHIEMQTMKNEQRGMPPAEARARAEREFGCAERYRDEVRDVRGATAFDDLGRDVRQGLRALRRAPAVTLIAVLCLALGIGANAAIFSVINAVLLRPLPYPAPERLMNVHAALLDDPNWQGSISDPNFRDLRAQARSFAHLTAYTWGSRNILGEGEPERAGVVAASANLFDMLQVRPRLGRGFAPDEDEAGRHRVVILSDALWQRRFAGDPNVIGRSLVLDGVPHTIIGVMGPGFTFPARSTGTQLWVPYVPTEQQASARGSNFLSMMGRLAPGTTQAQAAVELRAIADRLRGQYPQELANRSVQLFSTHEALVGGSRQTLYVLLGAVGLVLLIACANVANLLLARAAARQHEVAIRLALGAGRARLVRQLLVESLLLAMLGAAAGGALAWAMLRLLHSALASALPTGGGVALDGRVTLFLLVTGVLSGLLFGIVPALQASRGGVRAMLVEGGGKSTVSGGHLRVRSALIVAEIALSLVLLVGAGLLLRGFMTLNAVEPGVRADGVLTAHVAVPRDVYSAEEVRTRLLQPMLEALRAIPGVQAAGMISMLPIQQAWTNGPYSVVGEPAPEPGKAPIAEFRVASPGLFAALGVPLRRGRDFRETEPAPVVIVNEALATHHFPNDDPVGRQINGMGPEPLTIVGVIGDIRQAGLDQPPLREIYYPYADAGLMSYAAATGADVTLVVQGSGDAASLTPALRRAVRTVDPTQPVYDVMTMEAVIAASLADRRLQLGLLGGFALVALVLSAAGLYGVVSYLVAQRTREIGVRMALGAQTRDVVRLVLGHGVRLIAAGVAVGLAGAYAATRLLESLLFGVSARDPLTYAVFATVLAGVALLATWVPARRATRVDPLLAIREG